MKKSTKLWIFIFILVIFNIVYYLGQWGGATTLQYVSDLLPVLCSLISVVYLFKAFRVFKAFDFTKKAWLMILIGIFLYFIAESIYAILEIGLKLDMNENFPSIADYFWCIGYLPLFIGLIMMVNGYRKSGFPMGNSEVYIVLLLLFFILPATVIYFLLIPIIFDTETSFISKFFYLFYPIADLFLVIPAVILMYITRLFGMGTISQPWKYLAFGFILLTIADLLYSYLGWRDLYGNGNLIDVAWHSSYLLFALAALYQRELVESLKKA